MRPTPLTARKASAALTALMLSAALAACQPQISAAGAATPSAPTPTDQAGNSTDSSDDSSQTSVPQGLESFYNQDIDWQDCSDGTSPFQCGTVTVPWTMATPAAKPSRSP